MDDSLGAKVPSGVYDVHRAFDVGTDVTARGGIAVGNGDEGGEVEDYILSGHCFDNGFVVADIPGVDSHLGGEGGFIEPTPASGSVVADEAGDFSTLADEFFGEVTTDESSRSGDEDALAVPVHDCYLSTNWLTFWDCC